MIIKIKTWRILEIEKYFCDPTEPFRSPESASGLPLISFDSVDSVYVSATLICSVWSLCYSARSANNICLQPLFVWEDKLAAAELGPAESFYLPAVKAAASWLTVCWFTVWTHEWAAAPFGQRMQNSTRLLACFCKTVWILEQIRVIY